ncbi:MAG: NTP transferase domain-containing protein [Prevotella sp.]|nr:NTP transferase domain-containing protein [Prevotella sp.]
MKYAIIAAGEGSRLAQEGISAPKPLVEVHGECLIDRLIRIFMAHDAEEIVVICNSLTTLVSNHLAEIQSIGLHGQPIPLRYVVKSTPSSMHSFYELSRFLGDSPFVLTTVDTIFREKEFGDYIAAFRRDIGIFDGLMGVTDYIEDEKPLYVGTDDDLHVTGFYDQDQQCRYISGGIYGLTPKAIDTLCGCMERGESRMRNFQRALLRDGLRLKAYPFSKVLDIDHASDIAVAERFLKTI